MKYHLLHYIILELILNQDIKICTIWWLYHKNQTDTIYNCAYVMSVQKKKKKKLLSNKIALTKDVSAHLDFPALYSYFAKN